MVGEKGEKMKVLEAVETKLIRKLKSMDNVKLSTREAGYKSGLESALTIIKVEKRRMEAKTLDIKAIDFLELRLEYFKALGGNGHSCVGSDCKKCGYLDGKMCVEGYNAEVDVILLLMATTDWNNVSVDTPVLVKNSIDEEWKRYYFADVKHGKPYVFVFGCKSKEAGAITSYKYTVLER